MMFDIRIQRVRNLGRFLEIIATNEPLYTLFTQSHFDLSGENIVCFMNRSDKNSNLINNTIDFWAPKFDEAFFPEKHTMLIFRKKTTKLSKSESTRNALEMMRQKNS